MSSDSKDFYRQSEGGEGHFHRVIPLHESRELSWTQLSQEIPGLLRGWYELSRLPSADRIEFTRDYWFSKLPYTSANGDNLVERLANFFENLEDIGIYATQQVSDAPFEVHMIYSLKEGKGYFHGSQPTTRDNIDSLKKQFGNFTFPPDYLGFLEVHDGFCKYIDIGLLRTRDIAKSYVRFQQLLAEEILLLPDGEVVDKAHLIPFYESFNLHCYQCFYADWYPDEEMGNVYFSEPEKKISNIHDTQHRKAEGAFPTFLGWLVHYLEDLTEPI